MGRVATAQCSSGFLLLQHAHRLTATVWPLAMTTLYTSAEAPLPITSSRRMSPARHSTAHAAPATSVQDMEHDMPKIMMRFWVHQRDVLHFMRTD